MESKPGEELEIDWSASGPRPPATHQQIDALRSELQAARDDRRSAIAKCQHLQEQLQAAQAEIERLGKEPCQCACHKLPDHGKLQDALEALKFHQDQLTAAQAECGALGLYRVDLQAQLAAAQEQVREKDAEIERLGRDTKMLSYWQQERAKEQLRAENLQEALSASQREVERLRSTVTQGLAEALKQIAERAHSVAANNGWGCERCALEARQHEAQAKSALAAVRAEKKRKR